MQQLLVVATVLISLIALNEAMECKIEVKFRSDTDERVKLDMVVPSLAVKTEPMIFTHKNQNKKVMIKGDDCEKKHWIIRTYRENDDGDWVLAKKIQAKFFGRGWFRVLIQPDFMPIIFDRMGVMCSDGNCG